MKLLPLAFIASTIVVGTGIFVRHWISTAFDMYTDQHGDEWKIPTQNFLNTAIEWIIDLIPRSSYKFQQLDLTFDMDNEEYLQSQYLYIFFAIGLGALVVMVCIIFFCARYICKCCGGTQIKRGGYTEAEVNSERGTLIVFSFLIEACLIYGIFSNNDVSNAVDTLIENFKNITSQYPSQFESVFESLPKVSSSFSNYYNYDMFQKDLQFTISFTTRTQNSNFQTINFWETIRYIIVILNIITTTLACALGIAAGSVRRSGPVIGMIILSGLSGLLLFISFGWHFAGTKTLLEYCREAGDQISSSDEFLPNRFQYFVPCVSSPLYSYITDYYFITAITETEKVRDRLKKVTNTTIAESLPLFTNLTDSFYDEALSFVPESERDAAKEELKEARAIAVPASILEQSHTCRWTKERLQGEDFLLCKYTLDALEMLTLCQLIAAIIMVFAMTSAMGAVKVFQWAGTAGISGANKGGFIGMDAKPKRKL